VSAVSSGGHAAVSFSRVVQDDQNGQKVDNGGRSEEGETSRFESKEIRLLHPSK